MQLAKEIEIIPILKQRVAKLEKALEEIIAGPELYHRDSTRCWQIAKKALAKEEV